jgi:DsbC/DsbD-like thiol-disulfide interchange protein
MRNIETVMSAFRALLLPVLVAMAPILPAQTGLKVALVPESTAIVPGATFRLGLLLQPEPGWHTYWKQPGIVGVPTQMDWSLPEGFKAGELEYPGPEPVLMFHIKAQGYRREVLLQTQITAPADLRPGTEVRLRGRASWMCCGNTCHPGSRELEVRLPVAGSAEPDPRWAPVFERERQAYSRESAAWQAEAEEEGMRVSLTLRPATEAARALTAEEIAGLRFYTEDGWINSDEDQQIELGPNGSLRVGLVRAEVFLGQGTPGQLHGVLRRPGGWLRGEDWPCLRISPKIHRAAALKDSQSRH